jgi:hypothetical protein
MQCKELEAVLEQDGFSPLPVDAREHLAGCTACQDLLADLSTIVATAKEIPAEVTPPDRLWISLRAQLQAEGVIKEQPPVLVDGEQPSWWQNLSAAFRPRILAPAGIGIALALGIYFQTHKTAAPPVETNVPVAKTAPAAAEPAKEQAQVPPPAASQNVVAQQSKPSSHSTAAPVEDVPLRPSPSELASTTLSNVERDVPDMQLAGNSAVDTSLRQNLRTLNEFIAECQQRLKQNPQDALAREYLYSAYQQKAELLSAMMESGRSEH